MLAKAKIRRLMTSAFLAVSFLGMPSQGRALEIYKYDQMTDVAKNQYRAYLYVATIQLLQQQGRHDDAEKVRHLFNDPQGSNNMPLGMEQFYFDLQATRRVDQERAQEGKKPLHIEHAFVMTLANNGIRISANDLARAVRAEQQRDQQQQPQQTGGRGNGGGEETPRVIPH